MCRTPLPAGLEIVVEHGLDVKRLVTRRHGEDAGILLYDHQIAVLVDYLHEAVLERVVLLAAREAYGHSFQQGIVELGHHLSVDLHAASLEDILELVAAHALDIGHEPFEQGGVLANSILSIHALLGIVCHLLISLLHSSLRMQKYENKSK